MVTFDRKLGQPVLRPTPSWKLWLIFVALGIPISELLPYGYAVWFMPLFLVILLASCVLFTPYLLLALFCFYIMGQLPLPNTWAYEAWIYHVLLMLAVVVCLWRTWIFWPEDMARHKESPENVVNAPWWGFLLGGLAIIGLVALIMYYLHFQD